MCGIACTYTHGTVKALQEPKKRARHVYSTYVMYMHVQLKKPAGRQTPGLPKVNEYEEKDWGKDLGHGMCTV